jgi:diguanylate cyclase (GGDEF)-like protein
LFIPLRAGVIGAFALLVLCMCVIGSLAIDVAVHSAQQAETFQQRSLVPLVGLSALSQNIDQERDLLSKSAGQLNSARRRAVQDELAALDVSIAETAADVLPPTSLATWRSAWRSYLAVRGGARQAGTSTARQVSSEREILSNRLDSVLDVIQSAAGVYLNQGQLRYVTTVSHDWTLIRAIVLGVALTVLLAVLFGALIVRRLTRGLNNLIATAVAITGGKLQVRAATTGRDELSVVAWAFNHMTDSLLRLERTALTDPLTGLGNHRAFQEEFRRELARAIRHGHTLSLALLDLDDFKMVNDGHGHAHGDRVLATFATHLGETRVEDRPFRIGGDEFAMLLPYSSAEEARSILERLRVTLNTALPGVTMSVG